LVLVKAVHNLVGPLPLEVAAAAVAKVAAFRYLAAAVDVAPVVVCIWSAVRAQHRQAVLC
jgi:hypothetical protein